KLDGCWILVETLLRDDRALYRTSWFGFRSRASDTFQASPREQSARKKDFGFRISGNLRRPPELATSTEPPDIRHPTSEILPAWPGSPNAPCAPLLRRRGHVRWAGPASECSPASSADWRSCRHRRSLPRPPDRAFPRNPAASCL